MTERGTIDRTVGRSNALFLGYIATGMTREELVRRWKANEFPELHEGLAKQAMADAGLSFRMTKEG